MRSNERRARSLKAGDVAHIFLFTFSETPTFEELVKDLQTAIHRHNTKGGFSLIPVNDMIAFTNEFVGAFPSVGYYR